REGRGRARDARGAADPRAARRPRPRGPQAIGEGGPPPLVRQAAGQHAAGPRGEGRRRRGRRLVSTGGRVGARWAFRDELACKLVEAFAAPTDGSGAAVFRIAFGLLALVTT